LGFNVLGIPRLTGVLQNKEKKKNVFKEGTPNPLPRIEADCGIFFEGGWGGEKKGGDDRFPDAGRRAGRDLVRGNSLSARGGEWESCAPEANKVAMKSGDSGRKDGGGGGRVSHAAAMKLECIECKER